MQQQRNLNGKKPYPFFESSKDYDVCVEKIDKYTYILTKSNNNTVIEIHYLSFKTELDASKLEFIIFYSNHRVDDTE